MIPLIIYNNHIISKRSYCFVRITFVGDKMESICAEYLVNYDGENIGSARIEKLGIRFMVTADVKEVDAKTPFRLAAVCGTQVIPLGVMMPKKGGYTYGKTFTSSALREMGIGEISGFAIIEEPNDNKIPASVRVRADAANWVQETEPGAYLEEGEFRRLFSACKETLMRCEGEITYLAVPLVKGEEFPVMPVFCLGEAWKINGGLYIVFRIRNGKLSF